MRYWLYVTTYTYWLLMLLFGLIAANCFLILFIGDVGAHGEPPKPLTLAAIFNTLGAGVLMLVLAFISFFAGKQKLLSIVVVNVSMLVFLGLIGASVWLYSIFIITMPPVTVLLYRVYFAKT